LSRLVLFSRLELDHSRKIQFAYGQISFMQMTVNRGLRDSEIVCFHDMVEMLPFFDSFRKDGVILIERVLVQWDTSRASFKSAEYS
jgi:hypothetical protein